MRGVANQRDALSDEFARGEQAERESVARADNFQIAEMQAETLFKLGMKLLVRQRDHALGFAAAFGPDDRRRGCRSAAESQTDRRAGNAPRRGRYARAHARRW